MYWTSRMAVSSIAGSGRRGWIGFIRRIPGIRVAAPGQRWEVPGLRLDGDDLSGRRRMDDAVADAVIDGDAAAKLLDLRCRAKVVGGHDMADTEPSRRTSCLVRVHLSGQHTSSAWIRQSVCLSAADDADVRPIELTDHSQAREDRGV